MSAEERLAAKLSELKTLLPLASGAERRRIGRW